MKNIFIIFSVLIFPVYLLQSCDTNKEVLKNVTEDKLEKTYEVSLTDTLTIKMATNPTTGFKWYLVNKIKPKIITEFDRKYVQDDKAMNMVGMGGYDIWRFLPKKKGETYLHFVYKREDGKSDKDTFFKIVVKE